MASIISFRPFRLDPVNEQLWRGAQQLPLRPKPFAILHYLVEHPGRLITREEITTAVWPHTAVGESSLKGYIRALRDVLGDDPAAPQFIETVAWRGYRFIGSIEATDGAERPLDPPGPGQPPAHQTPALDPSGPQPAELVGREAELELLWTFLETALQGKRCVVFVTGEPGIGKTTLIEAFLDQAAVAGDLWVGRGQCLEHYGAGEAYLSVLEALGRLARAPGGQRLVACLRSHAPTWLAQLPALVDEAEVAVLQRRLQGVTRERMLREMVEAVEALTAAQPLVLWLEDLQWSDASTVDLLAVLAQRKEATRLLVIGTYRPADVIVSGHPLKAAKQELQAHGQCTELPLGCLPGAAVHQYLAVRFPQHQFPPTFGQRIYQATDGNPLFLVNVVDYCVAQGVMSDVAGQWQLHARLDEISVGIPESLQQLIAKQIERLTPAEQHVLEAASVAGAAFSAMAVATGVEKAVEEAEQWCDGLARRGQFLRAKGMETFPDETLAGHYQFLHTLYQQVIYERLSAPQRVRLHRRIAERVEVAYGSRVGERAAELAMHWECGQDARRAVVYLEQAAQTVLRRCAYRETLGHLRKGLELLKTLPATPERVEQELRLQLALGAPLMATTGWAAPELGASYARARGLCEQLGDTPQLFPALYGLWVFRYTRAELHTAQELAEQLLALAEKSQDATLLMEAHHALGNTLHRLGELPTARTHLEQGIALYDPQRHRDLALLYGLDDGVAGLGYTALVLWALGFPNQALQRSHEMLTLARELSHPLSLAWAYNTAAWHHQFRREGPLTQTRAEAGIALCTEHGFAQLLAVGTILRGWALAAQGKGEEGITQMRQGLAACQDTGTQISRPRYLAMLAEAYGNTGQAVEGLALLAEAVTVAQTNGEQFCATECYRLMGKLVLTSTVHSPKTKARKTSKRRLQSIEEKAEAYFQQAIALARCQHAKSLELRAVQSLSRLWQRQGRQVEAQQLLAEIYDWFTEGFDTVDLQETKTLLAELSGKRDTALLSLPAIAQ